LTAEKRFRKLREADKMSQTEMGVIIFTNASMVSKAETGENKYTKEQVAILKKHFKLGDAPFFEDEYNAYHQRFALWREATREGRTHEANEWKKKLAPILKLEFCEPELCTLYRLNEILQMQCENNNERARSYLSSIQDILDSLNDENKFHYNCRMGYLLTNRNETELSLKSYQAAFDLKYSSEYITDNDRDTLYVAISNRYTDLERSNLALLFLNKLDIARISPEKRVTISHLSINLSFAFNYARSFVFGEAERLLKICYIQATSLGAKLYIELVMFNFGLLYRYQKHWKIANEYFDKTLALIDNKSDLYAWALYLKAICLIELNETEKAKDVYNTLKSLQNKNETQEVLVGTLKNIMMMEKYSTKFDSSIIDYLENVSIPYFIDSANSLEAVNCYKLIEKYYDSTQKQTKRIAVSVKIREIYERLFFNGDE